MMHLITWIDPVSILSHLPDILLLFIQFSLYFWDVKRLKPGAPNCSTKKNKKPFQGSSSWLLFHVFPCLRRSLPLRHSGAKQYNEVWIVVYIFFLVSVLWFIVLCFFLHFFFVQWGLFSIKSNILVTTLRFTYGRSTHCTMNLSWRSDRRWDQDVSAVCFYWLRSGVRANAKLNKWYSSSNCGEQKSGSFTFSSTNWMMDLATF